MMRITHLLGLLAAGGRERVPLVGSLKRMQPSKEQLFKDDNLNAPRQAGDNSRLLAGGHCGRHH